MAMDEAGLDRTMIALSDPTRRAIIARLVEGEARVTEIAEPFDMSLNAVSKHVRILERAGLVGREVRGREHHISFNGAPLQAASDWIETYRNFWNQRLDALEAYLRKQKDEKNDG